MAKTPLQRGLALFDNRQSRFAEAIGTSQQNISNWLKANKPLPAEFVLKAETVTGIARHVWRPDIYPPAETASSQAVAA